MLDDDDFAHFVKKYIYNITLHGKGRARAAPGLHMARGFQRVCHVSVARHCLNRHLRRLRESAVRLMVQKQFTSEGTHAATRHPYL